MTWKTKKKVMRSQLREVCAMQKADQSSFMRKKTYFNLMVDEDSFAYVDSDFFPLIVKL